MKSKLEKKTSNRYKITLIPETPLEYELMNGYDSKNENHVESIQSYYHLAIEKLGNDVSLLSIDPNDDFPISAVGKIEISKGIGK